MQSTQDKAAFFNDVSATPKTGAGQEIWDDLVYQVVRKKLTANAPQQIRGHYVYEVAESWESKMLREDPEVAVITDISEFREALAEPGIRYVFVPKGTVVKREVLTDICEEITLAKTIFYERENNE